MATQSDRVITQNLSEIIGDAQFAQRKFAENNLALVRQSIAAMQQRLNTLNAMLDSRSTANA